MLGLLAGLHHPTSGRVLVGGQDLAELTDDVRHDLVSVVFQHPYLFEGTIADNILTGHPGANREELDRSCARACRRGHLPVTRWLADPGR